MIYYNATHLNNRIGQLNKEIIYLRKEIYAGGFSTSCEKEFYVNELVNAILHKKFFQKKLKKLIQ